MGFPKVDGMDTVMVVVDRFTKYVVFAVTLSVCMAEVAAGLFYCNVMKYFWIPSDIVSDHNVRFTGRFWTMLFGLMGTRLKFLTANHPQTDGQTKRINALLEEYLLEPFMRKFVLFFDDILVYSSTLELHLGHLRNVLEILKNNQLFQLLVKKSKCSFCEKQVEY